MPSNEIEKGRTILKAEGRESLAQFLFDAYLVKSLKRAKEFAETIDAFADSPLDVEGEGNGVKASLEMEDGRLHVSFRTNSFKLSFRNKTGGTASYDANSPVKNIRSDGPFLSFVLNDGETVRAVKENGTISIEHFAFGLYPI